MLCIGRHLLVVPLQMVTTATAANDAIMTPSVTHNVIGNSTDLGYTTYIHMDMQGMYDLKTATGDSCFNVTPSGNMSAVDMCHQSHSLLCCVNLADIVGKVVSKLVNHTGPMLCTHTVSISNSSEFRLCCTHACQARVAVSCIVTLAADLFCPSFLAWLYDPDGQLLRPLLWQWQHQLMNLKRATCWWQRGVFLNGLHVCVLPT